MAFKPHELGWGVPPNRPQRPVVEIHSPPYLPMSSDFYPNAFRTSNAPVTKTGPPKPGGRIKITSSARLHPNNPTPYASDVDIDVDDNDDDMDPAGWSDAPELVSDVDSSSSDEDEVDEDDYVASRFKPKDFEEFYEATLDTSGDFDGVIATRGAFARTRVRTPYMEDSRELAGEPPSFLLR